jgi:hypothetical protein
MHGNGTDREPLITVTCLAAATAALAFALWLAASPTTYAAGFPDRPATPCGSHGACDPGSGRPDGGR